MTNQQQIKYINKGLQLEILKQQINISLTKGEVNTLLAEALSDPDSAAAIKRILNPLLADKFPQFPTFTNITLGDTAEDGSTTVTLREPRQAASTPAKPEPKETPIKSMEPLVVNEVEDEESAPDYVDPLA
jgi:hypothetical protein